MDVCVSQYYELAMYCSILDYQPGMRHSTEYGVDHGLMRVIRQLLLLARVLRTASRGLLQMHVSVGSARDVPSRRYALTW